MVFPETMTGALGAFAQAEPYIEAIGKAAAAAVGVARAKSAWFGGGGGGDPRTPSALVSDYGHGVAPRGVAHRSRHSSAPRRRLPMYRSLGTGSELKAIDTPTISMDAVLTPSPVLYIVDIVPGSNANQRTGRRVFLKTIQLEGVLFNKSTTVDLMLRLMLIYDKQSNGLTPTPTQILVTDTIHALRLLDYQDRFKILIDDKHALPIYSGNDLGCFQIEKKFLHLDLPVTYIDNGGSGPGSVMTGGMFLMLVSNSSITSGTAGFQGFTRIRYYDA